MADSVVRVLAGLVAPFVQRGARADANACTIAAGPDVIQVVAGTITMRFTAGVILDDENVWGSLGSIVRMGGRVTGAGMRNGCAVEIAPADAATVADTEADPLLQTPLTGGVLSETTLVILLWSLYPQLPAWTLFNLLRATHLSLLPHTVLSSAAGVAVMEHGLSIPFLLVYFDGSFVDAIRAPTDGLPGRGYTPLAVSVPALFTRLEDCITIWSREGSLAPTLLQEGAMMNAPAAVLVTMSTHGGWKEAVREVMDPLGLSANHAINKWLRIPAPSLYDLLRPVTGATSRHHDNLMLAWRLHTYMVEIIGPLAFSAYQPPSLLLWDISGLEQTEAPADVAFYSPPDRTMLCKGTPLPRPKPEIMAHAIVLCRDYLFSEPTPRVIRSLVREMCEPIPSKLPLERWRVFRDVIVSILLVNPRATLPDPRKDVVLKHMFGVEPTGKRARLK